jgi:hypothetical protein
MPGKLRDLRSLVRLHCIYLVAGAGIAESDSLGSRCKLGETHKVWHMIDRHQSSSWNEILELELRTNSSRYPRPRRGGGTDNDVFVHSVTNVM